MWLFDNRDIFDLYPPVYTSLSSVTGTIDYSETDSNDALDRLMWAEVDFAMTVATSMVSYRTPSLPCHCDDTLTID
jgi:hypothetical protein